ncbi:hypothetical protein CKO40_05035 [Halochromatium glycolicum]|uniref:Uncharacterized protein n=1 Tax=Halochromatium glycolicum TaxID=85075 RepID=A0AAJ0U2C4_9GAMM|nr:hypothetical protein [Halochromatium glycolicum]
MGLAPDIPIDPEAMPHHRFDRGPKPEVCPSVTGEIGEMTADGDPRQRGLLLRLQLARKEGFELAPRVIEDHDRALLEPIAKVVGQVVV